MTNHDIHCPECNSKKIEYETLLLDNNLEKLRCDCEDCDNYFEIERECRRFAASPWRYDSLPKEQFEGSEQEFLVRLKNNSGVYVATVVYFDPDEIDIGIVGWWLSVTDGDNEQFYKIEELESWAKINL